MVPGVIVSKQPDGPAGARGRALRVPRPLRTLLVGLIGVAVVQAQTSTSSGAVPVRDKAIAAAFAERFAPDRRQSWLSGFLLARDLGAAVAPLLADLAQRESADVRRRLLYASAVAVAAGPQADRFIADWLVRGRAGKDRVRERVILGLAAALGGGRDAVALPWSGLIAGRLEPIESVALALAAAQFDPDGAVPADWYRSADPAVVAAAVFAEAPAAELLEPWLTRDVDGADLVRRGWYLGSARPRGACFADALRHGPGSATEGPLRIAAELALARAVDPEEVLAAVGGPLRPESLPALASEPDFRRLLWHRGLLTPATGRLPDEQRRRIAVAFALETDVAGLAATRDEWQRDRPAAAALCLALAWRLYGESAVGDAAWLEVLPDVREAEWVRLACGRPAEAPSRSMEDPALDRAFVVATSGDGSRLPRDAAAQCIEDALWRAGAHLALTRVRARQDLCRDLLLAQSTYGASAIGAAARLADDRGPSKGLSAGDQVFEIGYELYRYFSSPARPRPATLRLR